MGLFDIFKRKEEVVPVPPVQQPKSIEGYEENSYEFEFEIEDVFSISGRGTVVTGRVIRGTVMNGDTVSINGILDTRVLGIESFRSTKEQATAGEQVGLLLEDIERYQAIPGEKIYK